MRERSSHHEEGDAAIRIEIDFFHRRPLSIKGPELKSLSPVLSNPAVEPAGITVTGGPAAIMLKKYQDRYYLFIANPSPDSSEFKVKFDPDKFPVSRVMLYPEKRNIPSPGDSFTDDFAGYGAHAYEIRR